MQRRLSVTSSRRDVRCAVLGPGFPSLPVSSNVLLSERWNNVDFVQQALSSNLGASGTRSGPSCCYRSCQMTSFITSCLIWTTGPSVASLKCVKVPTASSTGMRCGRGSRRTSSTLESLDRGRTGEETRDAAVGELVVFSISVSISVSCAHTPPLLLLLLSL